MVKKSEPQHGHVISIYNCVISEPCYKGTILLTMDNFTNEIQENDHFVKLHGLRFGSHNILPKSMLKILPCGLSSWSRFYQLPLVLNALMQVA